MKRLIILFLSLLVHNLVVAQTINLDANESELEEYNIPSMGECIYLAVQNSFALESYDFKIKEKDAELQKQKAEPFNWVRLTGGGGWQNIAFAQPLDPQGTLPGFLLGNQVFYNAGIQFRASMFDIFMQKREKQITRYQIEELRKTRGSVIKEIEMAVIEAYKNLVMAHESQKITGQTFRDIETQRAVAEQQFLEGIITINEYADFERIASEHRLNYTQARVDFEKQLFKLQSIIGQKLIE